MKSSRELLPAFRDEMDLLILGASVLTSFSAVIISLSSKSSSNYFGALLSSFLDDVIGPAVCVPEVFVVPATILEGYFEFV